MVDTVRIARPIFARRDHGPGGRVEHDERGNAVWTRTRRTDREDVDISTLSVAEDVHADPHAAHALRSKSGPKSRDR